MKSELSGVVCALVVLAAGHAHGAPQDGKTQVIPLSDASAVVEHNAKAEVVEYQGRKALRVTVSGDDKDGLVILRGVDFQDGTIEAEIALKSNAPAGVRWPGFVGIAFRGDSDFSKYELFYLRPGNSHSPDELMRNHSVQYSSEPDFGWYALRRAWPGVYESHAELAFEKWVKVKIEVAGRSAKLYLDGAESPSLVIDGMKGQGLHGGVALWGYAQEEAYFSNVRITPATAQPVKNGSDAAGEWKVQFGTDYGGFPASMKLARDGAKVTGSWSGPLGQELPVTGTWRDGYVDLSFPGIWPSDPSGKELGGAITVHMAGWFDGDGGKGRVDISGRADGVWSAEKK